MTRRPTSILILTQFFPPETGAAQNRLAALVRALNDCGAVVTVLTTMPNYPTGQVFSGYRGRVFSTETLGSAKVYRAWIWAHSHRGIVWRGLSFASFCMTSLLVGITRVRGIDIVLWESPPLPLGLTAWILAKLHRAALVTNISDLWTESLLDLRMIEPGLMSRIFERVERFLYRASRLVSGQTRYIVTTITRVSPGTRTHYWPNGADVTDEGVKRPRESSPAKMVIGFAGVMGHPQGLETVIEVAKLLRDEPVEFVLVGDGPIRESLLNQASAHQLGNVVWKPQVPHRQMRGIWESFDCALVCLRRGKVFRGAVPSKLYEAMGAGLPILLAIEGEAAAIVSEADCGIVVAPEDPTDWVDAIRRLSSSESDRLRLGANARAAATAHFNRATLTRQFAQTLIGTVEDNGESAS